MLTEGEQSAVICEAQIKRGADDYFGSTGIATRTSCQRCEIFVIHRTANSTPRDIISADNSLNLVLQNCPKLIAEGYMVG